VHVAWQDVQFGMPTAIWYTRSADYGATFLPAVPVTDAQVTGAFSWEGNLIVAPGGHDLYLAYTTRVNPSDRIGTEGVWVAASHDDGLTWTQHKVTQAPKAASYLYPSIGLDGAGGLHVVYASNSSVDQPVWYSYSGDQGVSWSAPVKTLANVGAFAPWVVGGDAAGESAIAWYGVQGDFPNEARPQDWYFFAVRESGADLGTPTFTGGATTTTPIFQGNQTMPEFNELRLDSQDRIHLGAAAFIANADGTNAWALFHQVEN
jgi:hypothetical protein